MTVADAGKDRPQPFSGTEMVGELNTNGQLTLKYKRGGRGPAQPPAAVQSEDGEEILGMVVVDEPPNRPGEVPGVLVPAVDSQRYAVGPSAVAKGDIFAANQKPVTSWTACERS